MSDVVNYESKKYVKFIGLGNSVVVVRSYHELMDKVRKRSNVRIVNQGI